MGRCGLDLSCSGQGQMAGCCEHGRGEQTAGLDTYLTGLRRNFANRKQVI
jgi:hypothetical protein